MTQPDPERSPAVEAEGLTKVFHDRRRGDVRAVHDVSFTCRFGEIFGLLGPNGAGKTTTLRMLSTVLRPTAGSARVVGHDIRTHAMGVRSSIGFLSGSTGRFCKAIVMDRRSLSRSKGSRRLLLLRTVSSRNWTRSKVVKRAPQLAH